MTDEDVNKFRGVVKEELKPINEKLEDIGQRIDTLWDQTVRLTEGAEEVKETLTIHTKVLKGIKEQVEHNNENTKKMDRRLTEAENHLGIVPPPELSITT